MVFELSYPVVLLMIHKTVRFLKSSAKKTHKWLGFGPSLSILAIFTVAGISALVAPSAKLEVISPYSIDSSAMTLGGGAVLGDSSPNGEFSETNSTNDFADSVLLDNSSYLNNSGTSSVRAGQNGFAYTVKKGDNLSSIASTYKVSVSRLMSVNNIKNSNSLKIGQVISIPDMENIKPVEKVPNYSSLPDISGYLSFPLRDNYNEFRYLNYDHVDILSSCGTTVYSSAEGFVESVGDPAGWNGGLGGFVRIRHPFGNTPETYYAGTSKNLVSEGDMIEKGEPIAEVGNTGESDVQGCHLRFGVIGAKNPFAKYIF